MNKIQILLIAAIASTLIAAVYLTHNTEQDLESAPFNYDSQIAENLSGFSMTAYCAPKKIENWKCGAACKKNPEGLTDVYVMRNKTMNAGGYLGYSPSHDAILVVFRGTVPWLIKNWISDINTVKTDYPLCPQGCKVHLGFFNAFKELKSQMTAHFSTLKAKYPNSKVFVTGHSLGAAMATHAVPVVYELNGNKPIDAFYNFGSPRVGDENYRQWFDSQNFTVEYGRVNHNADPVPHLPPQEAPFKFTHINQEIFYKSFKKPFVQCLEAESKDCADGVKVALNVIDHLTYFGWDWATDILSCQ